MPYYPPTAVYTSTTIAFTDGDTLRRTTISDTRIKTTSNIICNVRRPDTTDDSADQGLLYTCNIVEIVAGAFDVLITCLDEGDDTTASPPAETITIFYSII